MNRLFVAYKPEGMVSNHFLSRIKRQYGVKKAGFSGILDPFAKGVLIVAFGQYTKLFQFCDKAPKHYRATLWMGAHSETLDREKISGVDVMMPFHPSSVAIALESMVGEVSYTPPRYSAKHVDGVRAYTLARKGEETITLAPITTSVYACTLVHYVHPFITFDITLSEGGYVRSIAALIAQKLGFTGALSALERVREGKFVYDNEKALNPLDYLNIPFNRYRKDAEDLRLGRVLHVEDFENPKMGVYGVVSEGMLSVVSLGAEGVTYLLNAISIEGVSC